MDTDPQDHTDMAALVAGEDFALNRLMDRHSQPLFHYLIRLLQNEAEAGDLAQETFVRVYQHRDRFQPRSKFSTWLYAIATNLARDRFRWRERHPNVSLDANDSDDTPDSTRDLPDGKAAPDACLLASERAAAVRDAVGALPDDLRTPLVLAEYEGRSHAEIAEITGGTTKAVEMRLYHARQKLRERLGPLLAV